MNGGRNTAKLTHEPGPLVLEQHALDGASEQADARAAAEGLMLADFECEHGRLGPCAECEGES